MQAFAVEWTAPSLHTIEKCLLVHEVQDTVLIRPVEIEQLEL